MLESLGAEPFEITSEGKFLVYLGEVKWESPGYVFEAAGGEEAGCLFQTPPMYLEF